MENYKKYSTARLVEELCGRADDHTVFLRAPIGHSMRVWSYKKYNVEIPAGSILIGVCLKRADEDIISLTKEICDRTQDGITVIEKSSSREICLRNGKTFPIGTILIKVNLDLKHSKCI